MTQDLECTTLRPDHRLSRPFAHRLGELWRRLTTGGRIDLDMLSPHMMRDLGLAERPAEDPLAAERRRHFF